MRGTARARSTTALGRGASARGAADYIGLAIEEVPGQLSRGAITAEELSTRPARTERPVQS